MRRPLTALSLAVLALGPAACSKSGDSAAASPTPTAVVLVNGVVPTALPSGATPAATDTPVPGASGAAAPAASGDASAASPAASGAVAAPAASGAVPAASGATAAATAATAAAGASAAASGAATAAATTPATALPTVSFTDIAGNINAQAIIALAQLGVIETTSGAFHPDAPVKRRDFVRWLYKTNNAVFADSPSHLIHPAPSDETPAFKDLPASDPDFAMIQGMNDVGNSVGFPDHTFKPEDPITREQAVAIKSVLDHGGINPNVAGPGNYGYARYLLPPWKDKKDVSVTYVGAIADDIDDEKDSSVENIGRTFGAISQFRPALHLTRGEAATMFQRIGGHARNMSYENAMRTVPATLHPSPSPSP